VVCIRIGLKKAQDELRDYMVKTMSASYELVEQDFLHVKPNSNVNFDINQHDKDTSDHHDGCRIIPSIVPNQTLRNMRHERACHILKGTVAKCEGCGQIFTSSRLIWNAIHNWIKNLDCNPFCPNFFKNASFPLTKEQIDIIAMRFTYDMEYFNRHPCFEMERLLLTIVLFRFNEHDFRHRKGCFKKSDECSFSYPRNIQDDYEVKIDWDSEPSIWYNSYGNGTILSCHNFVMEPKRSVSDVFLNTNNSTISKNFGYNNNIAMGNRNCIYYVTVYNTKGNQEEEQFPFLKHCTAIAKRIRKLREKENEIRSQISNEDEINMEEPNFSIGLGHVLSGILAHLSSTVISATMAWHLEMKESRFQFSHEFSHILLSQFESWLVGEDINFCYRRTKNKETW
jgi:hypothetical protein